jgi:putative cardiolipin synthase
MAAGEWPMEWSARYQFVADDPLKATLPEEDLQRSQVLTAVTAALAGAHQDLKIISPYFVPGAEGSAALVRSVKSGRRVQILTNSLVANDVAAVHGGYSRHRKSLLEGGVELWELKPLPGGSDNSSLLGSSGASLHTKALVLDDKGVFVGSYNLDPRSTWLNCEQGVFVENTVLAEQLEQTFRDQTAPDHSWRVQLVDYELRWSDDAEQFDSDPKASFSRRFQAWLARVLHLDAQL